MRRRRTHEWLRGVRERVAAGGCPLAIATVVSLSLGACTGPVPERLAVPADLPTDLGARALQHVRETVGFGPRHSGTPGWQRSVDYIATTLEGHGLAVHRDRWTDEGEGLTFENVRAVVPGDRSDRIVIACHHDTKITSGHDDPAHNFPFEGANDPGSGVGLLLALAGWLAANPAAATLELVFFDGEESVPFDWDPERALFGSRRYVQQYRDALDRDPSTPPIRAMILLDMVGAADLSIDRETWSTPALLDLIGSAAAALGHEQYFFAKSLAVRDDHLPFIEAGIPAVDLIDLADNPQWHTPDDRLEHLSAASMQIVGEVVLTALPAVIERYVPR